MGISAYPPVPTPDTNFYLDIARGAVDGYDHVNKFGHNADTTAGEDVWSGGGIYNFYPATGVLVDIVSTADSDNGATATGALTVTLQGLDENWVYQEVDVVMDGITPVTTLTEQWTRLSRAFVRIAGPNATNDGDITVYNRAIPAEIGVHIQAGAAQTLSTIYTVPAGKTAYFLKGYVGLSSSGTPTAQTGIFRWLLRVNAFGPGGAWLVQGEMSCVNIGSSHFQYEYGVPAGPIPERTDIRMLLVEATTAFDTVGGYDMILIDNDI